MKKILLSTSIVFFVLNVHAQFPNWGWGPAITVTPNGSSITCSVYDPVLSQNMTANYSDASGYINSQGVVAWTYSYSAHGVIYDINTHSFKHDSWSNSNTTFSNFSNTDGVIAWSNGYSAHAALYDPVNQVWKHDSWSNSTTTFSGFSNQKGVVAWSNNYSVGAATYNPSGHLWNHDSWSNSTTTFSNFSNSEGIVAWTNNYSAAAAAYNIFTQQWEHNSWSNSTTTFSDFSNQFGIVAWTNNYSAAAAVFDPVTEQWLHNSWSAGTTTFTNFNLTNGTLTYTNNSTNYQKGYNINSHQWEDNYTTNIYCRFYNLTSSGNAPLITYFNCLSIGANSYSYSCGDGHTITRRWAWKQYNNAGNYSPELSVFNASNNSTCNSSVNVDVGIEEHGINAVVIFPNPASSQLSISNYQLSIKGVEIFNTVGEKIFSRHTEASSHDIIIDASILAKGIYFVKLKGEHQERVVKLVKQ